MQGPRRWIDVSDTEAVHAFVEQTDMIGSPSNEAVAAFWKTVEFAVPPWLQARVAQLDPLSPDYFDLQDQLYVFLRGAPYANSSSEFTEIDKEAAIAAYLAYPDRTPHELNRYLRAHAKFADQFDSPLASDVLEVGSGWGFSTEYLARLGHRVTAIDINPDFVDVAARRSERAGLGIDYRLGSFEDLPLRPEEHFDIVYCFEAFHHAREPRATLRRLATRLRPAGQFILFGEPFIDEQMWPAWGLRLDPLSVYCIAKFGWWESGWTRSFMGTLFRAAGLHATFVDESSDLERYMIGRRSRAYGVDQLSHRPAVEGWVRDRDYFISCGDSQLTFYRKLRRLVLEFSNFSPAPLDVRLESEALTSPFHVTLLPGVNCLEVPLPACPATGDWILHLRAKTWNPLRVLGQGEDRELAFHLRRVEEEPVDLMNVAGRSVDR